MAGLAIIGGSLAPAGPGALPLGDKVLHLAAYAGWSFLVAASRRSFKRRLVYLSLVFTVGVAVEFIQPAVGRERSAWDLAANAAGIGLGFAAAMMYRRVRPIPKETSGADTWRP